MDIQKNAWMNGNMFFEKWLNHFVDHLKKDEASHLLTNIYSY
jgi:hypothetical protein